LKKLLLLFTTLIAGAAALFGAPAAITDLQVSEAASGFRHVGLEWTVPFDAAASTTPAYYQIRVSTICDMDTEAKWNANSGVTTPPYRIIFSTGGITAGEKNMYVVPGLDNGQQYFFAIKSSTDNATWSAVDTVSPRPSKTPFNATPGAVGNHNYEDGAKVPTITPALSWSVPSAGSDDAAYGDAICSYTVELSRYADFSTKIEKTGITAAGWTTSPLTENASYYWRVRAYDLANTCWAVPVVRSFSVDAVNEAPAPFALVSPVGSVIVTTRRPVFQWNATSDPDPDPATNPGARFTYTLVYSTAADFSAAVSSAGLSVTQYAPSADLEENATCYWKVYAVDDTACTTMATSTGTVRIDASDEAPLTFELAVPAAASKVLVSTPTLSWSSTGDPNPSNTLTYKVLYSSSDPALDTCASAGGLTQTQYITPALQEDATYWWRVQAVLHGSLAIAQTPIRTFFVDAAHSQPIPFDLVASSGVVATARPAFTWQSSGDPGGDPVSYVLQYSTAADFSVMTTTAGLTATTYTPAADLDENRTYYWRVRAETPYGQTRASNQTWTVAVDAVAAPPQSFALLAPADGAAVTYLRPTFVWQDTADLDPSDPAVTYTLFYSTMANFAVQTQVAGIAVSSYTVPGTLVNGTTYYWKVRALSTRGESTDATGSWQFVAANQAPGAFAALSPAGALSANTVTFTWATSGDPEGDALSYTLIYSSAADFGTAVSSAGLTATHCTLPGFAENRTYYWYVTALDAWDNARPSAQTLSFSVNAVNEPPQPFALTAPAAGTRVTTAYPALSWQAATDPDPGDTVTYTLWLSRNADFAGRTAVSGLTATAYTPATALTSDTTWYWKIIAVASDGLETAAAPGSFFVGQSLRLPAPETFAAALGVDGASAALSWSAVTTDIDGAALNEIAGYRIYKSYDFDGLFTGSPVVSVAPGTLAWTDTDVRSLPVYYLVRAYTLAGKEGRASAAQKVADADSETMNYTDDRGLTLSYRPQSAAGAAVTLTRRNADETNGVVGSYTITVTRDGQAVPGFVFAQPATIAFKLPQAAAAVRRAPAPTAGYAVYWFNGVAWVSLGGQVVNGQLTVQSPYPGRYQLRAVARAGAFSVLKVWPKIITPNGDGVNDEFNLTFENPAGDRVEGRIYDISGSRVGRMEFKNDFWVFWDGREETGGAAPSGMYLYQVTVGDHVYNGTAVVAR
jgi:hypothetical protein